MLDWKEEGLVVRQVTQFPVEQSTTLKIEPATATARTIHVRIPGWATGDAEVKINGRALEAVADPGSYLAIRRVWQSGDTISIRLPMELRQEPLPGDDSINAVLYGPLVLAADLGAGPVSGPDRVIHSGKTTPDGLPAPDPLPNAAPGSAMELKHWVHPESISELRFIGAGESENRTMMPLYQIRDQRYSVYWQVPTAKG
jgi:hypothetical protein